MSERTVSVRDVPLWGELGSELNDDGRREKADDILDTYKYAEALAAFIRECDTPITIGVQGEWGSGKTSLLNMIQKNIKGQIKHAKTKENIRTVTINTWEHSLLKSPEEALLSIIQEIINEISQADRNKQIGEKAKNTLKKVAQGVAYTAVTMTAGFRVADRAEELIGTAQNTIKELRRDLARLVSEIKESQGQKYERFVVFVDDLDRLEPSAAVQILELLKNIFEVPDTVFVLAIDYQVVVKGLKGKFGEPTEENEWEFRAFFDKIIQVPFLMPMAQYNMVEYVEHLLRDIQYFDSEQQRKAFKGQRLIASQIVQRTMGRNPRSLKRLANSLSLIRLQHLSEGLKGADAYPSKVLLFALVCFQIGFPNIFELLLLQADFTDWTDEGARRFIHSRGKDPEPADLEPALEAAKESHSGSFEDEWECALFRVVWAMKWQRQRIWDACRVLNLTWYELLQDLVQNEEERRSLLRSTLRMAATTSVISWDASAGGAGDDNSEQEHDAKRLKRAYWQSFRTAVSGVAAFSNEKGINAIYSSGGIRRPEPAIAGMNWNASVSSTGFLSFGGKGATAKQFLEYLQSNKTRLLDFCDSLGARVTWDIKGEPEGPHRARIYPNDLPLRLDLSSEENAPNKDLAMAWLADNMAPLVDRLAKKWQEFQQRSSGAGGLIQEASQDGD